MGILISRSSRLVVITKLSVTGVYRKTLLDARRTVLISNREKEQEAFEQRKTEQTEAH